MKMERRRVAMFLLGAIFLVWRKPLAWAGGQDDPRRNPTDQIPPTPEMSAEQLKAVLKENQEKIKKDVDRLYDLVSALKKEVEKTDSSKTLSLNLVKKAEEVEKLAHHIKTLALG